jgi:pyrroline-5-carboxylate reductase
MAGSSVKEMTYELAIVGGGNMGAALLEGLLAGGVVNSADVVVVEKFDRRRDELVVDFPGVAVSAHIPACRSAVLAVKPAQVPEAAAAAVAAGATRLLSIAAGVTTSAIVAAAGAGVSVVRAMPNTPALVGAGVSAIAGADGVSDEDLDWADWVLSAVGVVVRVDEPQLDAVTGLTGSGPAYVFLVAEALIEAGVLAGLDRPVVEQMVTQLLVGSAALLADRGDPASLREMVTSPGGTTAAGLRVLEDRALRSIVVEAVQAASDRSRELGR